MAKPINCKAAVLWTEGKPLVIEDITVDPPQEGEVRVKMAAAGLCATDAHFVWGIATDLKLDLKGNPLVLGHEGAGVVESCGPGVTSVKPGDKVMLLWMPECGKCSHCKNPKTNLCEAGNFETTLYIKPGETRMHVKSKPLLSFGGTATFSQYSVVREYQLAKLNPNADLTKSCIIGCAVGTGYGSATNIAKVHQGSVCAIWGLGAIGLSCILGCAASGAKEIIGVDVAESKKDVAIKMGATKFVNPMKDKIDFKVDYAFDCIGNQKVLDTAQACLQPWGTLTVVGLAPSGSQVCVKVKDLLTGQCITGGFFGNGKPRELNQSLVDKHVAGKLCIDPLISDVIELSKINEYFELLKTGKAIRTVIKY